jgi:N-glycosylase/DNA lyase
MVHALAQESGEVSVISNFEARAFPSVSQLAALTPARLRGLGFGYRAEYVVETAIAVERLGGEEWLESLKSVGYREARKALMQLSGVGPKVADCVCLFGLRFLEAVPVDVHVWNRLNALYHPDKMGEACTPAKADKAADHFRDIFGDLAGIAHQYLFVESLLLGPKESQDLTEN